MRQDVEFKGHNNCLLRGWFYLPETATPNHDRYPTIVMTHGLSATKSMSLEPFAKLFAESGIAVLVYDHQNFGASDGEPRQSVNPWVQARDYIHAIDWLVEQNQVDENRIGVCGSSFSGGEAIVVGACDERVKAVVVNVPLAGFEGVDYSDTEGLYEAMRAMLYDNSGNGLLDKAESSFGPMKVVKEKEDDQVLLGTSEASEWFLEEGSKPNSRWLNSATMVNCMVPGALWDPAFCIAHMKAPLLMVVASNDRLCSNIIAVESFERAPEPKKLVTIEGHHFSPYNGEAFTVSSKAAIQFFERYL